MGRELAMAGRHSRESLAALGEWPVYEANVAFVSVSSTSVDGNVVLLLCQDYD